MTLSEELQWRGFVNQTTLDNINQIDTQKFTFYWGIDPSDDSMTVGNFAIAMMVRHFINHGHKAVLLVGGATGLIGDPGGKDEERLLQSLEQVAKNKAGIAAQYKTIFAGQPFEMVDNYDWFKDIRFLEFLRDVGKHFSMTQLLDRDFVQSRIGEGGSGISFTEFSYSLVQGYDFLHLYRTKGVTLQVCGSDQWGNSISGVELIRKLEGKTAHIWSAPLVINKATGKKFGKSEAGAVWLSTEKTSVYKFYQFWLNVDDEGVVDYLKIYTFLPKEIIDHLEQEVTTNPQTREAQKTLAYEVTKIVHGEQRAQAVQRVTGVLFGETVITALSEEEIAMLAAEIPTVNEANTSAALIAANFASSNSEARRLISAGAVSIDGHRTTEDETLDLTRPQLIKKGKNNFCINKYTSIK